MKCNFKPLFTVLLVTATFYIIITIANINSSEGIEYEVKGWEANVTRNVSDYIMFSDNASAHILPKYICDYASFLIIIVCSKPENFEARNAIRQSWGQERMVLGQSVQTYFLLGEINNNTTQNNIQTENEDYNDIIQENFLDTYNNLTLKSVQLLKLMNNECKKKTNFVLKSDDDMFINVKNIVEMLNQLNSTKNILLGKLICGAYPIRDPSNKWYAPSTMYDGKVYPNYLSGTSYLMSIDVAEKLLEAALKTPIFYLEDIYITGICAKNAKVSPRNNPHFSYQKVNIKDFCKIAGLFTIHKLSPENIRLVYDGLQSQDVLRCPTKKPVSWLNTRKKPSKNVCQ